jgi:hypothetical protein
MGVVRKLKPQPGEGAMMLVEEGFGSLREVCIAMHAMQTLSGTASAQRVELCHACPCAFTHACIARAAGVLVGMKMDTAGPSTVHSQASRRYAFPGADAVRHYLGLKCCTSRMPKTRRHLSLVRFFCAIQQQRSTSR